MNQGGEPEHDDYGLPRVDIEVPDDARELYADVQAYHRELRAIRRHERSRRWRAPLTRPNAAVPVIAGSLILAMIASMVLTLFSVSPGLSGVAGPDRPAPSTGHSAGAAGGRRTTPASQPTGHATGQPTPSPATTPTSSPTSSAPAKSAIPGASPGLTVAARLPGTTISVAGQPVALRELRSTALAIVPAHCQCASVIGQLLSQAGSAGIRVYLVGSRGSLAELTKLALATGPGAVRLAIDARNVLSSTYRPVGLTVLLVDSRGSVAVRPALRAGFQIEAQLRELKSAG